MLYNKLINKLIKPLKGILMPLTVQASEARAQFPKIARKVHDEGVEVTVIRGSRPYVKIVPLVDIPEKKPSMVEIGREFIEEYDDVFKKLAE